MKTLVVLAAAVLALALPPPASAQETGEVKITTPTLPPLSDVANRFNAPGVREVEVAGLSLTAQQVNETFLSTDPAKNVLVQIRGQLKPGQEVEFRTADGQRFRVLNEAGELRARLRDVTVPDKAALASFLTTNGFTRVEIRGVDLAGNRIRVEVRNGAPRREDAAGRALPRDEGRDDGPRGRSEADKKRTEPPERFERIERGERPERIIDRTERKTTK